MPRSRRCLHRLFNGDDDDDDDDDDDGDDGDDDVELNVLGCRVDILGTNCDHPMRVHDSMLL